MKIVLLVRIAAEAEDCRHALVLSRMFFLSWFTLQVKYLDVTQQHIPKFMCWSSRVVKCWVLILLSDLSGLQQEFGNTEGNGACEGIPG